MIPSRGVYLACRAGGYRISTAPARSSRQFSSLRIPPKFSSRPLHPQPSLFHTGTSSHRPRISRTSTLLQSRFISSQAPPPPETILATPDSLPDALADSVRTVPTGDGSTWYYGYLNDELGGFGWGPTAMVQWVFEHIHILTENSSIGYTVIATSLLIRLAMSPLIGLATRTSAQMKNLNPVLKPLAEKAAQARKDGDQKASMIAMQQSGKIRKDAGVKLRRLAYPLLQVFTGFATWRLLRNMADHPVAGMGTGGFLWFPNLAAPDQLFLLPMITAVSQHVSIRLGGEVGNINDTQTLMRKFLMWGLPCVSFLVTSFAPAAITLNFAVASMLTIATNLSLKSTLGRRVFKIPKTVPPAPKVLDVTRKPSSMSEKLSNLGYYIRNPTALGANARKGYNNYLTKVSSDTSSGFLGGVIQSPAETARANARKKSARTEQVMTQKAWELRENDVQRMIDNRKGKRSGNKKRS